MYENKNAPAEYPDRMDVFVWKASADAPITTFSTIGMATRPMVGARHRAELHFSVRGRIDKGAVGKGSKFLANLAMHPFINRTNFDWWHKVREPGAIPLYSKATSVLFHPRFVDTGWDSMQFDEISIRILNVVPITPDEYAIQEVSNLQDHWMDINVDLFEPR
ncbi:MAG TPA: suppressor of fused domain protein [Burkholderiales bacterium]|nr:suppressor of fused domain protein [Burkholderiales bacterium]